MAKSHDGVPVVTDIGNDGGITPDGRAVMLEFQMQVGRSRRFEFPRRVADRLASVLMRLVDEARLRAGPSAATEIASTGGALPITPSMIDFQANADGSGAAIVVRRQGAPPILIQLEPHDFQPFRAKLDDTERLMLSRKAKPN
jgi:hypothetical protein